MKLKAYDIIQRAISLLSALIVFFGYTAWCSIDKQFNVENWFQLLDSFGLMIACYWVLSPMLMFVELADKARQKVCGGESNV